MTKSFEQVLEQEKNELTEALILFGEGKRVNKALADFLYHFFLENDHY